MGTIDKHKESSVSEEIIRRIHCTLADMKTGEDMLNFLRSTEPVFMHEVNRFINTELSRMRYQLTEQQAIYISSVVGASYIAGFLIAREASHVLFDGIIDYKSDIKQALTPLQINAIIDKKLDEGKSYKDIAKVIRHMLDRSSELSTDRGKIEIARKSRGKKLDIGNLD